VSTFLFLHLIKAAPSDRDTQYSLYLKIVQGTGTDALVGIGFTRREHVGGNVLLVVQ
jgi:hypothetical protein